MSPVLRISIGANLVLLAVVVALLARGPARAPAVPAPRGGPAAAQPGSTAAAAPPRPAASVLTPAAIAQLEQSGVSRDTLISVVLADLNRRSTQRLAALQQRYAPKLVPDRELRRLAREDDAEQVRALKDAFGEDGYRAWDQDQALRELNRARPPGDELPMSAAEAAQASRAQREFDAKSRELQQAMEEGDADRAESGELLAQAQRDLDRKLEQLLGEQRFQALRGGTDPTTEVYRKYGDLNPTPDQAQAVLAAEGDARARQAALTDQLRQNPGAAADLTAQLQTISEAQDQNLRQIFGAEAYDTLKRQSDPTYQTLQQYAGVWNLQPADVQSVYATLRAFQDQADRLRAAAALRDAAGQPVDWRAVNAQIEQARQQTESGLQNQIGSDRLAQLEQNGVLTVR